jgi:hypothetical protein
MRLFNWLWPRRQLAGPATPTQSSDEARRRVESILADAIARSTPAPHSDSFEELTTVIAAELGALVTLGYLMAQDEEETAIRKAAIFIADGVDDSFHLRRKPSEISGPRASPDAPETG